MHLVAILPGAKSEPHDHVGYETWIYVLAGTVLTRWATKLEHDGESAKPGSSCSSRHGVPHEAVSLRATRSGLCRGRAQSSGGAGPGGALCS